MGPHDDDRSQSPTPETQTTPDDATSLALIEEQADRTIRRVFHDGRWHFSVIDVIGVLTDSPNPGVYWRVLKLRLKEEGGDETVTKCNRLKMTAADGKQRLTDAADTETLLRIIQSVPSPKAEPVKQWLARVGARRLEEATRPLDPAQARAEATALHKPSLDAPSLVWAEYHEQLAILYRRQAAYDAQLAYVDARLDEHEDQIGELHDRLESNEQLLRLVPEILERLGPQTLSPEHQRSVQNAVKHLHDLTGWGYQAIYADLMNDFNVGKYSDIPEARWHDVAEWFQHRIAAEKRRAR